MIICTISFRSQLDALYRRATIIVHGFRPYNLYGDVTNGKAGSTIVDTPEFEVLGWQGTLELGPRLGPGSLYVSQR